MLSANAEPFRPGMIPPSATDAHPQAKATPPAAATAQGAAKAASGAARLSSRAAACTPGAATAARSRSTSAGSAVSSPGGSSARAVSSAADPASPENVVRNGQTDTARDDARESGSLKCSPGALPKPKEEPGGDSGCMEEAAQTPAKQAETESSLELSTPVKLELPLGTSPLADVTPRTLEMTPESQPVKIPVPLNSEAADFSPGSPNVLRIADSLAEPQIILQLSEALESPELGTPQMPTVGSAFHGQGRCKPCAFLHTKGCSNGVDCQFCHLCQPGEKKRRLKTKKDARLQMNRMIAFQEETQQLQVQIQGRLLQDALARATMTIPPPR